MPLKGTGGTCIKTVSLSLKQSVSVNSYSSSLLISKHFQNNIVNMARNNNLNDMLSFEVKIHSGHSESSYTLSITKVFYPEPLTTGFVSNHFFLAMIWTNLMFGFFYRMLLFYNVWKTGGLFGRPINILTRNFEIPCCSHTWQFLL